MRSEDNGVNHCRNEAGIKKKKEEGTLGLSDDVGRQGTEKNRI